MGFKHENKTLNSQLPSHIYLYLFDWYQKQIQRTTEWEASRLVHNTKTYMQYRLYPTVQKLEMSFLQTSKYLEEGEAVTGFELY